MIQEGFTCSFAVLRKSGKLGAKLAVGAVLFLFVQNIVGVSIASAFGLLLGSITGGPAAQRLIRKYNLKSSVQGEERAEEAKTFPLTERKFFDSVLLMLFAAFIGSYISALLQLTGLNFPYYVGCLFGGALIRNLADMFHKELRR